MFNFVLLSLNLILGATKPSHPQLDMRQEAAITGIY